MRENHWVRAIISEVSHLTEHMWSEYCFSFMDPFLWLWLCLVSSSHPYLNEILVRHASMSTWKSNILKIRAKYRGAAPAPLVNFMYKKDHDLIKMSSKFHARIHIWMSTIKERKMGLNSTSFKMRLYLVLAEMLARSWSFFYILPN